MCASIPISRQRKCFGDYESFVADAGLMSMLSLQIFTKRSFAGDLKEFRRLTDIGMDRQL